MPLTYTQRQGTYGTAGTPSIPMAPFDQATEAIYQSGSPFALGLLGNRLARDDAGHVLAIDDTAALWLFPSPDMSGANSDITSRLNLAGMLPVFDQAGVLGVACDGLRWWVLYQQGNGGAEWGIWVLTSTDLSAWAITRTVLSGLGSAEGLLVNGTDQVLMQIDDMTGDVNGITVGQNGPNPDVARWSDGTSAVLSATLGPPPGSTFDLYANRSGPMTYGAGDMLVYSCTLAMPTTWGDVTTVSEINGASLASDGGQPCPVAKTVRMPRDVPSGGLFGGDPGTNGMAVSLGGLPFYVQTDGLTDLTLPALTDFWMGWIYAWHVNTFAGGDSLTHFACGPLLQASTAGSASCSFTAVNSGQISWAVSWGVEPLLTVSVIPTVLTMPQIGVLGVGVGGAVLYGAFTFAQRGLELGGNGFQETAWRLAADSGVLASFDDASYGGSAALISGALGMTNPNFWRLYVPGRFGGAAPGQIAPLVAWSTDLRRSSDGSGEVSAAPLVVWGDGAVDTTRPWVGACIDAEGTKYAVDGSAGDLYAQLGGDWAVLAAGLIAPGDTVLLLQVSRQSAHPGQLVCIHGQEGMVTVTYCTLDGGALVSADPVAFPTDDYVRDEATTGGDFVHGAFATAAEGGG